jgi:hypothetical protein
MSTAAIIIGCPGAGKSSALDALGSLLETEGVEFGAIEADELARGLPWLGLPECLPQLAAVIGLQRELGRTRFLVVATPETSAELAAVIGAVGAARTVVVRLDVSPETAAARVAAREPDTWPGKVALVAHARTLATAVRRIEPVDVVIDGETLTPAQVAAAIRLEL